VSKAKNRANLINRAIVGVKMSDVTTAQLPAHLLAPYVAAAAREVLAGERLSDPAADAVKEAAEQLRVERIAVEGGSPADLERAAALVRAGGNSLHLASLALAAGERPTSRSARPDEQVARAAQRLDEIIGDLDRLLDGDKKAAARLDDLFETIVERSLAPATVPA
jgi:hypothetical protein